MKKKYAYILVDGSSYLFRAYHALPPLTTSEGLPTGAVFGVVSMLKRLEQDYPQAHIIVVFDPKGGSFRKELYDAYKAERVEMPGDLAVQIPYVHQLVQSLGFPLLIVPGYEADDVIASLVRIRHAKPVLISTLDKDLAQLVTEDVHLVNTMHNKYLDPQAVVDKFGVRPDQIRDLLALMGDRSDNVPGVPGVGPKTAAKWLNTYETIDGIIAHQEELKGKVGEKFRAHVYQLELSKQLVSLVDDIELVEQLEDIEQQEAKVDELRELYQKLGFKKWLQELSQHEKVSYQYRVIENSSDLDMFVSESSVALLMDDQYMFLAFQDHSLCVPQPMWHEVLSCLKGKRIITHDVKANWAFLKEHQGGFFDLMLAQYVLDSTRSNTLQDILGGVVSGFQYQSEQTQEYMAYMSSAMYQVGKTLRGQLIDQAQLGYYEEIEMALMPILAQMQIDGMALDEPMLASYAHELKSAINVIETKAHGALGRPFNLSSPKQIRSILFDELGLEASEKTAKGEASTSESALTKIKDQHLLVPLILKHRTYSKLYGTYALPLSEEAAKTGRVCGTINQALTITGRLSSNNPNLQNIPVKTKEGRMIRSAFIAPPGWKFLSADYSQVELRILAHFSQDQALLSAFANNEDVHSATAARIHGILPSQVNDAQRRDAKAVNFGLIYGMGAHGLAKQLNVSKEQAQQLISAYFDAYPGVKRYLDSVREGVQVDGYVKTVLGRKLWMPQAKSKSSGMEKQAALRAAVNAPMQGSASDMIKLAMIKLIKHSDRFEYKLTMQVHDELLFEVREKDADAFRKHVIKMMEDASPLSVPVVVDAHIGDNWDETH